MTITSSRPATPDSYVPSRRTVLRAAAWTAPAVSVAVAVPAYAAASSPVACADANYQVRWASHYNAQSRTAVAGLVSAAGAGTVGSAALTLSVTSRFFGDMEAGSTRDDGTYSNFALSPRTVGGTTHAWSHHHAAGQAGCEVVLRHAEQPPAGGHPPVQPARVQPEVQADGHRLDGPSRRPTASTRTASGCPGQPAGTRAGGLSGAGTSGSPWRPTGTNTQYNPVSGARGNVGVSYVNEPASAVYTITYWNDQTGTLASRGLQGVFLTDLTFTASSCA